MDSYYEKIIEITREYLGPAAGRFVDRQISNHLHKNPADLEARDIPKLAIRIRSGLVVLTNDEKTVNEAFHRINSLAEMEYSQ